MADKVYALGFFDGVHIAHAELLRAAANIAGKIGGTAAALTFDRQPGSAPLLTGTAERLRIMREEFGISDVTVFPFTQEFMAMPWKTFLTDILIGKLGAAHLVAGYDYRFGKNGEGNVALLKKECEALGVGCTVIGRVETDGQTVSSTAIRAFVSDGDMKNAAKMLGRPFSYSGTVQHGYGRGKGMGSPTINIPIDSDLALARYGVYAAYVVMDGKRYGAVANIGVRPTVSDKNVPNLETFMFDFDGDAYGKDVRVELIGFVRPEKKFSGIEELSVQIEKDKCSAMRFLEGEQDGIQ